MALVRVESRTRARVPVAAAALCLAAGLQQHQGLIHEPLELGRLSRHLGGELGIEAHRGGGAQKAAVEGQALRGVDFGVEPKQEILAVTSPRRRMARLVELLETSLEALRVEATLRERAGQNGKVSPLDDEQ